MFVLKKVSKMLAYVQNKNKVTPLIVRVSERTVEQTSSQEELLS